VSKKVGSGEQESSYRMIGIGRLYIGIWIEANFWLPKFIVILNLKNFEKLAMSIIYIFLQGSKFTLPSTAPNHVWNCLSEEG